MKKKIFSILFAMAFLGLANGQDKPVKFTVEVSTDSILMDNYFEVKFILENANGQNFEAPDFSENFNVLSGPNFSTSMSIVNGDVTQSMTIKYLLEPKDIGAFYILPANVETSGQILETAPLEVLVVPNPDGIKQSPERKNEGMFFEFGNPFNFGGAWPGFDFKMPFGMEAFPDIDSLLTPQQIPEEEILPKKKKRKTTRI